MAECTDCAIGSLPGITHAICYANHGAFSFQASIDESNSRRRRSLQTDAMTAVIAATVVPPLELISSSTDGEWIVIVVGGPNATSVLDYARGLENITATELPISGFVLVALQSGNATQDIIDNNTNRSRQWTGAILVTAVVTVCFMALIIMWVSNLK